MDNRPKLNGSYRNFSAADTNGSEKPTATRNRFTYAEVYPSLRSNKPQIPNENSTKDDDKSIAGHCCQPNFPSAANCTYAASFPNKNVPSIPAGNLTFMN